MGNSAEVRRLTKAIEKIVASEGTKAERARALYTLGCDLPDVVELLEMNYSQAHSIRKKMIDAESRRSAGSPSDGDGATAGEREAPDSGGHSGRVLFLSPSQTRYATQDGHVVVRVDTDHGPECRQCRGPLVFTLQYLAFVHQFSNAQPTKLEDFYVQ